ncbi:MAG: transcription termination/antitermination protein NusA [Ectothiorhodospiraceae bacterium AqS1]|nr:transcription termination/antitermination protein NusA [Ectothiorhodospiraceae bacterium AqS1]
MSKEILNAVETLSAAKGVSAEAIFDAIESALETATRKRHAADIDVRVDFDRRSGDFKTFRRWEILDDSQVVLTKEEYEAAKDAEDENASEDDSEPSPVRLFNPELHILFSESREQWPDEGVGDFVEEAMENNIGSRIAAQVAKQVIIQKVREAERAQVFEAYRNRVGEMVSGVVKRKDRGGRVILDLSEDRPASARREAIGEPIRAEAEIGRDYQIPREIIRTGDRLRGYLEDVREELRGPQLFISRIHSELMVKLFTIEVPEIAEGMIEIMGCARDPGSRAKIGVRSKSPRIDPVGACVGMRGSRVQAVSNELAGERVDIVLWDEDPAQYVIKAMSPAEVSSIYIDEESMKMDIVVQEDQLPQAIGRGGQNVKLASQLTGWDINVLTPEQWEDKKEQDTGKLLFLFMSHLDVDEDIANILVEEGFTSIEDVAYVPRDEMLEIDGFDDEVCNELQSRARDDLLERENPQGDGVPITSPAEDLLMLEGMDTELARKLTEEGVVTREDLAELDVDEFKEKVEIDEERAADLIMTARQIWFDQEEESESSDVSRAMAPDSQEMERSGRDIPRSSGAD